jgi:DNA-binding NarL/FixJ family response regulator
MPKSKSYRVVIVDDHEIFIEGLSILFEKFSYVEVIASYSDPVKFMDCLVNDKPDVVFMDVELPGIKGYDLTKQAIGILPSLKVIALTMCSDGYTAKKMLDSGAVGYLTKGMTSKVIDEVFDHIKSNTIYIAPEVQLNQNFQTGDLDLNLSNLDIQIIQLLSTGKSSSEIGAIFNISERTTELEKTKLFKKFQVNSAIELVTIAYKLKILT